MDKDKLLKSILFEGKANKEIHQKDDSDFFIVMSLQDYIKERTGIDVPHPDIKEFMNKVDKK